MLTILDGISRFLLYLNISQKYLNRLYTIAASIPIFYIFKLALRFYVEKNTPLFLTNMLLFIFFLYFLILNFMYYFLGKNSRFDITQYFAKVLPDEVFLDNTGELTLGPEICEFGVLLKLFGIYANEKTKMTKFSMQMTMKMGKLHLPLAN